MASIYCEQQRGGLCRLHALNAFFGRPELDEKQFDAAIARFDARIAHEPGFENMSFRDWDFLYRGMNVVSLILLDAGVFARYHAIGELRSVDELNPGFSFCFDAAHIWGVKRVDGVWFRVDSIGGVRRAEPQFDGVGYMVPTTPIRAFYNCVAELHAVARAGQTQAQAGPKTSVEPALGVVASLWTWMAAKLLRDGHEPPEYMLHFLDQFAAFEAAHDPSVLAGLADDLRRKYPSPASSGSAPTPIAGSAPVAKK